MGEIPPSETPYLDISVGQTRDALSPHVIVILRVSVLVERLPKNKIWKNPTTSFEKIGRVQENKFTAMTLAETREKIGSVLGNLAVQIAPHLYEIDPRIGKDIGENPFPESPLFDPVMPIRRPSVNSTVYWTERDENPFSSPDTYEAKDSDRCAFCSESVIWSSEPEEVVWGGGNIGWVHQVCAPWIKDPQGKP